MVSYSGGRLGSVAGTTGRETPNLTGDRPRRSTGSTSGLVSGLVLGDKPSDLEDTELEVRERDGSLILVSLTSSAAAWNVCTDGLLEGGNV